MNFSEALEAMKSGKMVKLLSKYYQIFRHPEKLSTGIYVYSSYLNDSGSGTWIYVVEIQQRLIMREDWEIVEDKGNG